jgi:hypothetical protein
MLVLQEKSDQPMSSPSNTRKDGLSLMGLAAAIAARTLQATAKAAILASILVSDG